MSPYSFLSGVRFLNPYDSFLSGGDEENRTLDPLLAKQVLSQLSYTPTSLAYRLQCGVRRF